MIIEYLEPHCLVASEAARTSSRRRCSRMMTAARAMRAISRVITISICNTHVLFAVRLQAYAQLIGEDLGRQGERSFRAWYVISATHCPK